MEENKSRNRTGIKIVKKRPWVLFQKDRRS